MTLDSLLLAFRDTDVMFPLLGSLVAGALIGGEREFQGKPAGLRTHTLVCFAAALMTLLGLRMAEWVVSLPPGTQLVSDMSRMPHAILTGIGFLGAGVIFREGASVQGLTTAASLWLTAALGIVFGTGLMELATIGTVVALLVLIVLRFLQRLAPLQPQVRLDLQVAMDSPFDGNRLAALLQQHDLYLGPITMSLDREKERRRYQLLASARHASIDSEGLLRLLQDEAAPLALTISPLENDAALAG